jgi:glycosyltransferase involved in cell wall biosynthesis
VVSDGSTDRTVELARRYADRIQLIVFEQNRGYGAAIKEAWKSTRADLLGFLDADGTCDPRFFADLCNALLKRNADIALGCRLNKKTQMPALRQAGNFLFALLLSLLSKQRVRDTASGMRVLRREAYVKLLPLPNGLHFTPAMSARAILGAGDALKIVEIDMPYYEREGQSKLRVVRDGLRFLGIILETAFLYHPARLLGFAGLASFGLAVGLMAAPVMHYLRARSVDEWMLYRFILGHLAATLACLMFAAALLSRRVVQIAIANGSGRRRADWIDRLFLSPGYWAVPLSLILCGAALVGPNLVARATGHQPYEHWSRFLTMSFFFLLAGILISARLLFYFLDLVAAQLQYLRSHIRTANFDEKDDSSTIIDRAAV